MFVPWHLFFECTALLSVVGCMFCCFFVLSGWPPFTCHLETGTSQWGSAEGHVPAQGVNGSLSTRYLKRDTLSSIDFFLVLFCLLLRNGAGYDVSVYKAMSLNLLNVSCATSLFDALWHPLYICSEWLSCGFCFPTFMLRMWQFTYQNHTTPLQAFVFF